MKAVTCYRVWVNFQWGKKLERAKSNKADFLDLQLLVGVAKIRDPDLLLISFLASVWSVPLSQVVIRRIFISIGTNFIWAEVSLTCRSWLRHGWKLVVAPISSLKTWNLGIVFFSQYYVVTKYSFWRQIISVSTGENHMYLKDRCSTVIWVDGLDGWDGTLGGKNLTLLKRDEKDI